MKNYRYISGVIASFALIAAVIFLPLPSMLKTQSPFLARSFLWLLALAFLCLYRTLKGPSAADRAVAIDMLGILMVGFCAILTLPTGRDWYIDIAIAWALQSFIGIMALAKYMEGKHFDD